MSGSPQEVEDYLEAKRIEYLPPELLSAIEPIPLVYVEAGQEEGLAEGNSPLESPDAEPSESTAGLDNPSDATQDAGLTNSGGKTEGDSAENIHPSKPAVPSSLTKDSELQSESVKSSSIQSTKSDIQGSEVSVGASTGSSAVPGESCGLPADLHKKGAGITHSEARSVSAQEGATHQGPNQRRSGGQPQTGSNVSDGDIASNTGVQKAKLTNESSAYRFPGDGMRKGGKRKGGKHKNRNRSGQLISYVVRNPHPEEAEREPDSAAALEKRRTGELAVRFFLHTQSARWKSLTEMEHFNPGFDVLAVAHDGEEEFIEVKGQSAAWTEVGVALTSRELQEAQKRRGRYWLCVVEYVHDDLRRRLYLFQDPFGLANQFRFDSGWKDAAIATNEAPLQPQEGLLIEIPGDGRGKIISVTKRGKLSHIHVLLDTGKQKNLLFKPDKMTVSER